MGKTTRGRKPVEQACGIELLQKADQILGDAYFYFLNQILESEGGCSKCGEEAKAAFLDTFCQLRDSGVELESAVMQAEANAIYVQECVDLQEEFGVWEMERMKGSAVEMIQRKWRNHVRKMRAQLQWEAAARIQQQWRACLLNRRANCDMALARARAELSEYGNCTQWFFIGDGGMVNANFGMEGEEWCADWSSLDKGYGQEPVSGMGQGQVTGDKCCGVMIHQAQALAVRGKKGASSSGRPRGRAKKQVTVSAEDWRNVGDPLVCKSTTFQTLITTPAVRLRNIGVG